jgi:predicted phosphoribosyltransferase
LSKACEALRDVDHDYLVKFVVQRAATPIKSSKHVPSIVADCYQSWKASKVLKQAGAVSREEIDRMIEKEREELARKRAELSKGRRK